MLSSGTFAMLWYLLIFAFFNCNLTINSGGPYVCLLFFFVVVVFLPTQFDSKIIASAATMVYISSGMLALKYYSFILKQITFYCARE